jgi:hypothetical protein
VVAARALVDPVEHVGQGGGDGDSPNDGATMWWQKRYGAMVHFDGGRPATDAGDRGMSL